TVSDWRSEIDSIDAELLGLLNRRAQVALRVGDAKRRDASPLYDPHREREVILNACRRNAGPLDDNAVANVFQRVIDECRRVQRRAAFTPKTERAHAFTPTGAGARVAYQGERGSFSEEAAVELLPECVLVPRPTFESLFEAVEDGSADYVLAPFENSLMGSINRCHDLLLESRLQIVAEVVRRVTHCLVGCRGATLDTVETVESHPVALAECERFFAAHPRLRRVASDDTAASVRRVVERGDARVAAVAGRRAAEIYGGRILQEHLEDHREDYTRFVLLAAGPSARAGDKLSLAVRLTNRPGAIRDALETFARRGVDLLSVESRPFKGRPWQYHFFIDLRAPEDEDALTQALDELGRLAEEVRVLGRYRASGEAL
ncbi:MAG TPA: prephenate dehydratase, partial [Pyrinomonadaceae bacterium]